MLGGEPGTPGSGVPGPRIGYMPQEIALVEELTIKETIYYFGRIYEMAADQIRDRYRFLKQLLDLPDGDRQLGFCSGGQQRRVSFAAAMVHAPELLILDEPTVGLDPVLRERIWDFLLEETKSTKLAVIITTHYIDETKKASKIGLMRGGVLLAEDSPQNLLNSYNTTSLEDAFLKLCIKQGTDDACDPNQQIKDVVVHNNDNSSSNNNISGSDFSNDPKKTVTSMTTTTAAAITNDVTAGKDKQVYRDWNYDEAQRRPSMMGKIKFTSKTRMKALLAKNFIQMIRQPA